MRGATCSVLPAVFMKGRSERVPESILLFCRLREVSLARSQVVVFVDGRARRGAWRVVAGLGAGLVAGARSQVAAVWVVASLFCFCFFLAGMLLVGGSVLS